MTHFRLPRKTKKALAGKLWLYPADEKGDSLMAHPGISQEDYTAIKQGVVQSLLHRHEGKTVGKDRRKKLNQEIMVSDEKLRSYVNDIFREDLRQSSYNTLIKAKNKPRAIIAYYNFVNAYHLLENGDDSFGNICCLAVDLAKDLLKDKKARRKKAPKRYKR
jgi:hypothetical protein